MKRLKCLLAMLASASMLFSVSAREDDEVRINYSDLPQKVRTFLETNFDVYEPKKIEYMEVRNFYDLELYNGYDLKFAGNGDVIEIEAPDDGTINASILEKVLPANAVAYLKANSYIDGVEDMKVVKRGGYLIELDKKYIQGKPMRKLRFDSQGNIITVSKAKRK